MGMGVGFAGPPGSQQYETLTWFSLFIFGWGHSWTEWRRRMDGFLLDWAAVIIRGLVNHYQPSCAVSSPPQRSTWAMHNSIRMGVDNVCLCDPATSFYDMHLNSHPR
jgi:hypothetical protein